MAYVFIEHPSSLEHITASRPASSAMSVNPEQPTRLVAIERELDARGWFGFERMQAPEVERSVLTAVHPESHVAEIERFCAAGGGHLDEDTVVGPGSWSAALHAAGGAVRMVDLLLDGDASAVFCSQRPPGHHAMPTQAMGFCVFNNVAIAARYAVDVRGLERVMIFDWDVHHGNSTNAVFHDSDKVLFASIHQSPLFPGTGAADDVGEGAGVGFTVNLPVRSGSGDEVWLSLVEHVVVPLAYAFEPQLFLVSAGYDAHLEDPMADCNVTDAGFSAIAHAVAATCRELGTPLGAVLEGGYALGTLGRGVASTLQAMSTVPGRNGSPAPPLARDARQRLAEYWPELAAGPARRGPA
jgi:acetoin utilization deacetylase AcuC-like enzyme